MRGDVLAAGRTRTGRAHSMRFGFVFSDNDVFSGPSFKRLSLWEEGRSRNDPSIHDVIDPHARPSRLWQGKPVRFRDR